MYMETPLVRSPPCLNPEPPLICNRLPPEVIGHNTGVGSPHNILGPVGLAEGCGINDLLPVNTPLIWARSRAYRAISLIVSSRHLRDCSHHHLRADTPTGVPFIME